MTTVMLRGASDEAAVSTYSIIGTPDTWWSTFGSSDFIRVPLPAARTTTWMSGWLIAECYLARCAWVPVLRACAFNTSTEHLSLSTRHLAHSTPEVIIR